jgi:hypothetical protein
MSTMSGMADGNATDSLWNWAASMPLDATPVRSAIASALSRPVAGIDAVPAPAGAVLCDVWTVGGDFPTLIDCYLVPSGVAEATIAAAVAVRLAAAVLFADDTLNPTRYVLAEPDGTLRAVHVDEAETDDGPERRHLRPCTGVDPACAAGPGCDRSRFKPRPAPERPAAA